MDICICSINQPTTFGFTEFIKGQEYDLDKLCFFKGSETNKMIRENLRKTYFKKKPTEIKNTEKAGGKRK